MNLDDDNSKEELSSFIKAFGKVSSSNKQITSPKNPKSTPIKQVLKLSFGEIPKKKEKKIKIPKHRYRKSSREIEIIIHRFNHENIIKAYKCEDRKGDGYSFCINEGCVCNYKNMEIKEAEIKRIILSNVSESDLGEYGLEMISKDWRELSSSSRSYVDYRGRTKTETIDHSAWEIKTHRTRIDNFIKTYKFVYGLEDIVGYDLETNLKPIFEVIYCIDKIKNSKKGCDKLLDDYNGYCYDQQLPYCKLSNKKLVIEAFRRIFIQLLKENRELKISKWDKTILAWDWNKLSKKQKPFHAEFIIRHIGLQPQIDKRFNRWKNNYEGRRLKNTT